MATPFKMKGMSFGNLPMKQKKGPIMPKDHPVIPPTKEESKKSKGTLGASGKIGLFGIEGPRKGYSWDGRKYVTSNDQNKLRNFLIWLEDICMVKEEDVRL